MDVAKLHHKWHNRFMLQDGLLVEAMNNGDFFLMDEISLADDSVLKRLNSVSDPERKLALAEKGGPDLDKITAHPNFFPSCNNGYCHDLKTPTSQNNNQTPKNDQNLSISDLQSKEEEKTKSFKELITYSRRKGKKMKPDKLEPLAESMVVKIAI